MFKTAGIARFRATLEHAEARRHWREVHGALASELPGLQRYVQSHVLGPLPTESGVGEETTFFDGFACMWFADRQTFVAARQSPEARSLADDAADLFDMAWLDGMRAVVDEWIIKDGEHAPFKVVWVARFKGGLALREASDYWTNTHGKLALRADGVSRYVQNHTVEPLPLGSPDGARGFDGFSECWFEDRATFERTISSPEWQAVVNDGYNVFEMDTMLGAVLEEHVIRA